MSDMNDWNTQIIEEFRANDGKVGGQFEGAPLTLLHHRGARTGTERVTPLMYQDLGDGDIAVFASKAGAPDNPDWYHNVTANPRTEIEIGTETRSVTAREATGDERDRIWEAQVSAWPQFGEYQDGIDRTIPVVVLEGT